MKQIWQLWKRCWKNSPQSLKIAVRKKIQPVKNKKNFRVNLGVAHTSGKNTNPDGTMLNDRLTIQAGVSAKLDLFKMGY